ncbi:hypothetical protein HNY73_011616 [Argiope bruennichi]|uniref:Uncharacterized protein n=1 Tax=Argiope bruennichi TaxID=94029 RepID=A0A8T0F1D2_ARGBR|nr:hypothetical protein HNY73_011616 [Argiope bruennichi]
MCPRSTESFLTAFSAKISAEKISHLEKNVSECASTSPDLNGFKQVQKRKKIKKDPKLKPNQNKSSQQVSPKSQTEKESFSKFWKTSPRQISNSAMMQGTKSSVIKKMTKNDACPGIGDKSNFEHLGVSTLEGTPVLHPEIDTEMTISSTSEDMLEYDMSEELEETSEDVCTPPPPSIREKRPKLKYIIPTKKLVTDRTPKPGLAYSSVLKQCAHCGFIANSNNTGKKSLQPAISSASTSSDNPLQIENEPSTSMKTIFVTSPSQKNKPQSLQQKLTFNIPNHKNNSNVKTPEPIKETKAAKRARLAALKKNKDLQNRTVSKDDFLKKTRKATKHSPNIDPPLNIHPSDDDILSTASETDILPSSPKSP